jgi:hypothetical protein
VHNHRENLSFHVSGMATLEAFPPNSIVLRECHRVVLLNIAASSACCLHSPILCCSPCVGVAVVGGCMLSLFSLRPPRLQDSRSCPSDPRFARAVSLSDCAVNGDLNNNLVKYPHQCEGVRPDIRLVRCASKLNRRLRASSRFSIAMRVAAVGVCV